MTVLARPRSLLCAILGGVLVLAVSGCATAASPAAAPTTVPSPTPTAACPAIEGVEHPPECAPYDPEDAMAANDAYRQRMDLDQEASATNEQVAGPVADALEPVRASGDITAESVRAALERADLTAPQVREDYSRVLFGASGPAGGCIYGEVTADAVTIDVGGYILDGGCLPAQ